MTIFQNVTLELDLCNYAVKTDLKNAIAVDTLDFAERTDLMQIKQIIIRKKNAVGDLSNLKSKADKLDIDKFEITPVDLSKLSDIVHKKLLKRLNKMNQLKKLIKLI